MKFKPKHGMAKTRLYKAWTNNHQYYNDGYIETTELRCSCCRETVHWDIELPHKPYFCENCGADLREEQTGENAEQGKEKNK